MNKAVEIDRMLTSQQRQALKILANAERPLRNKDFHERFETDGRGTTGWAKALGPCTKPRNHDPESLRARGLVTVIDNRYYTITPVGREVAARPSEKLGEFRSELGKLLPSSISRPFLCDGSPLECSIFIVGTNSAREVNKPFWSFWSDSHGFNKADYVRELEQLRRGLTVTRKNIEIVARAAGPAVTLDTNIYLQPTPTEVELRNEDKNTDVVEYLLKTIRPKVVLSHGVKARRFFKKRCRDFAHDCLAPQDVTWDDWQWQFRLLCSPHLSFRRQKHQAAAEEAERIGQTLAEALH